METQLRKLGNSKGAVIPAKLLKELNIELGDRLEAKAVDGSLVITPMATKPKYALADLLAQCDSEAPLPEELREWDESTAVGVEI